MATLSAQACRDLAQDIKGVQLVRIRPEMVEANFELLKLGASYAMPVEAQNDAGWQRLFAACTSGELVPFLVGGMAGTKRVALGLIIAQPLLDAVSSLTTLNLWSVYAYQFITDEQYSEAIEKLLQFAKQLKARLVTGVTRDSRLIDISEQFGADVEARLITFEVK